MKVYNYATLCREQEWSICFADASNQEKLLDPFFHYKGAKMGLLAG